MYVFTDIYKEDEKKKKRKNNLEHQASGLTHSFLKSLCNEVG